MGFKIKYYISLFIVILFTLFALIFSLPGWLSDDAFISFRYAKNLAEGNGLVFNIGERVEGYSNFLWVIILSFLYKYLDISFWVSSRLLGASFSAGAITLLFFFTRYMLGRASLFTLFPSFLLSFSTYFIFWTNSGLETSLFTFLFLLSIYYFIYEEEKRIFPLSSVWMGLAALTRPEGVLLFVTGFCVRIFSSIKDEKRFSEEMPWYLKWIGLFLLIFIPFILWRLWYYGDIFPNTYYAKATGGGFSQLNSGATYIWHFLSDIRGYLFLLLIPFVWLLYKGKGWLNRLLIIFSFSVSYTLFIFVVGGDWMNNYRFFSPLLGFVMLFFVIGLIGLIEFFKRYKYPKVVISPLLLFLFLSTPCFNYLRSLITIKPQEFKIRIFSVFDRIGMYESENVKTGEWLKKNCQAINQKPSIGLADIGKIPYFTGFETIDFQGLIDPHIAKLKGGLHTKIDVDYIIDKDPDFIYLTMYPDLINGYPTDQAIFRDERFVHRYDFLKAFYNEVKSNPQRALLFKKNGKKYFTPYMKLYKTADGREPKVLLLTENEKEELRKRVTSSNPDDITKEAVDKWRGAFKSFLFSIPKQQSETMGFPLKVPKNAFLKFSIALGPETWDPSKGDGVEFQVLVKQEGYDIPVKVFSFYIDPKNRTEDRKWHDFDVNLKDFEGRHTVLILRTLPGPKGDNNFDYALWGNPMVVVMNNLSYH